MPMAGHFRSMTSQRRSPGRDRCSSRFEAPGSATATSTSSTARSNPAKNAAGHWVTKMPGSSRRQAPGFALYGKATRSRLRRMGLRAMQHVHHRPRTALRYARMGRLVHYDGGYAEYLLVPHERYLIALSSLKPTDAAPLTDAALTPYRAIKKALAFLEPDYHALVIGLGGLGQYGLKLLNVLSGCPVIVVDVSEQKLRLARQMGAAHVVDGRGRDVAAEIRELTNGRGVSAAFDFVGTDTTLDLAVRSTRSLGKVSQIGLAGGSARLKPLEIVDSRSSSRPPSGARSRSSAK